LEKVKESIEKEDLPEREADSFTWNAPHLHFKLVLADNIKVFVIAVVYPFELSQTISVLWIHPINRSVDDDYVKSLMKEMLYGAAITAV
jgi:S1-C subfamily serine protease